MRRLFFALIMACDTMPKPGGSEAGSDTDSETGETAETTDPSAAVSLQAEFVTTFSTPTGDQVYNIAPIPQWDDGCFAVGNPYYDSFRGSVSVVCPNMGNSAQIPDDSPAYWVGDAENQALGCNVRSSVLPDGEVVLGSSQFNDPTYEGRLLLWPLSAPSGTAVDAALVDMIGASSGDGNTGGYLGTTVIVVDGRLMASQTNAIPYLLGGEYAPGMTAADLSPLVEGGSVYCGRNCGGFAGYSVSVGDAGDTAWVSFGGVLQHLDASGTPDWYAAFDGDGPGEYAFPETNVTRWSTTTRLLDGSPVLSVFARESRSDGEVTYARVFDAATGEETADLSNVYGVAQGSVSGTTWTAYGVIDCDPSGATDASGGCAFGYIHAETSAGDSFDLSLPFESGSFPAAGCLLTLESAGDAYLAWYCKDQPWGGIVAFSPVE